MSVPGGIAETPASVIPPAQRGNSNIPISKPASHHHVRHATRALMGVRKKRTKTIPEFVEVLGIWLRWRSLGDNAVVGAGKRQHFDEDGEDMWRCNWFEMKVQLGS